MHEIAKNIQKEQQQRVSPQHQGLAEENQRDGAMMQNTDERRPSRALSLNIPPPSSEDVMEITKPRILLLGSALSFNPLGIWTLYYLYRSIKRGRKRVYTPSSQ